MSHRSETFCSSLVDQNDTQSKPQQFNITHEVNNIVIPTPNRNIVLMFDLVDIQTEYYAPRCKRRRHC